MLDQENQEEGDNYNHLVFDFLSAAQVLRWLNNAQEDDEIEVIYNN